MKAMSDLCADRFERFGTAGNASRIKPLSLSAMAGRYASGSLDPVIG
jgi:fructose-bisphosphate aldolase class II